MEEILAPEPQVRKKTAKSIVKISDGIHITGTRMHYVNSKVSPLTNSQEDTAKERPDLQAVVQQIQGKKRTSGEYIKPSVSSGKKYKCRKSENAVIKRNELGNKSGHTCKKTGEKSRYVTNGYKRPVTS